MTSQAGPTSSTTITTTTSHMSDTLAPSPTGFPPGPSVKTVTQTSTALSPDTSSSSGGDGKEDQGLAVGPPGYFGPSQASQGGSAIVSKDVDGEGKNGGDVDHMRRLWNCTIPQLSGNSTNATTVCTLLDTGNNVNGTHANATQLALDSFLNSTGTQTNHIMTLSSPLLMVGNGTIGDMDAEEEVEEEWEIVYECDEYEPLPSATPSSIKQASTTSATTTAGPGAESSGSAMAAPPVPAGQGSEEMIALTPSPVNVSTPSSYPHGTP